MKHFQKILALVLSASLCLVFAGCSPTDSKSTSKEFRVGMECAYAPFNWTQSDSSNGAVPIEGGGYAGGYDIEIAKKVAAGLGKKLVVVKTKWDGLAPAVQSGTIDAIVAGMSPTAERKTTMDFTDNYYKSDLVIVVKKDGTYASAKTLADFKGARITAQQNTFHYTVIDQIPGVKKQTAMTDFPNMVTALNAGVIDGYISERPGAISAIASNPKLAYVSFEKGQGFKASDADIAVAIGLKKNSPLKEEINKALSGISDSEREQIMEDAVKHQPLSTK